MPARRLTAVARVQAALGLNLSENIEASIRVQRCVRSQEWRRTNTPDPNAFWRAARRIAGTIGVRIRRHNRPSYNYDGRGIIRTSTYDVFHELAHYQLASPTRRGVPDYGLGEGPTSKTRTEQMVGAMDEEKMASLLGILWEARLFPEPIFFRTLGDHSWLHGGGDEATQVIAKLAARGFVRAGNPVPHLRPKRMT